MSHTPGPWRTLLYADANVIVDDDQDDPVEIATIDVKKSDLVGRARDDANARLIAAAPELLAACSAIWDVLGGWEYKSPNPKAREALALCRAAITKAHGPKQKGGNL